MNSNYYNSIIVLWNYDLCSTVCRLTRSVLHKSQFPESVATLPNCHWCCFRVQLKRALYCDFCSMREFSGITTNLVHKVLYVIAASLFCEHRWTECRVRFRSYRRMIICPGSLLHHFRQNSVFQLGVFLKWVPGRRPHLTATLLCLGTFGRPFVLSHRTLSALSTKPCRQRCIRVWVQLALCMSSTKPTIAHWLNRSAILATTMYQPSPLPSTRRDDIVDCCVEHWTLEVPERNLFRAYAWWSSSAALCRGAKRRRLRRMVWRTTAHALRVTGWPQV